MDESPELRLLFHRLNNQLGIILAHAELLEAKAADEMSRARAAQVVASALEAMGTAKEIRQLRLRQIARLPFDIPVRTVGHLSIPCTTSFR